ncbi:hypothetical protein ACHAXN_012631 [Cyclotella atomus]
MMSWLNLANQTALITGAASGIGKAVAQALAREGCHLLLADVQADHLIAVVSSCREATSSNISIQTSLCNVVDKSQVQNSMFVADNIAHGVSGSKASILVNCAGITRDAKISNISDTDWEEVLGVNLKGTFNMCQAFCETDRAVSLLTSGNNGGSIINIGSIVSTYGNVGQCNYAASKGGVVGLTRALAKEMALLSFKVAQSKEHMQMSAIRVNCIQPGFIETPMANAVPDKILSEMKRKIALRKLGSPDDVADLCCFLASSRSSYITGETMECSGMLRL